MRNQYGIERSEGDAKRSCSRKTHKIRGGDNSGLLSNEGDCSLPLIGSIAYYLPLKDRRPCADGLSDEMQRLAQAEMMVLRGECRGIARFYDSIGKDGRSFPLASQLAMIGAIIGDDAGLFDAVIKDIAAYPSRSGVPGAKRAVEFEMTWLRRFLHAQIGNRSQFIDFDFSSLPGAWRRPFGYLAVGGLRDCGELRAAAVLSDALLSLDAERVMTCSSVDIGLKMEKAAICLDEGHADEAARWCRAAASSAKSINAVLPFVGELLGPKSMTERAIAAEAPELLRRIKKMESEYFRNLVKYHNRLTGESVTDELTLREFFLAKSLKRGLRYKEIAGLLGVSEGRVHNMVVSTYEALGVKCAAQIGGLVW